MANREFKTLTVGFLEENCYLVPSAADACLYLIDPGTQATEILAAARQYALPESRILLTHAHIDHIGAIPEVVRALAVRQVHLHLDDLPLYRSPKNELPPLFNAVVGLPEPEPYPETCEFRALPTPGHTRGGVSLYFPRLQAVFTGDTLFHGNIGRTDFPGGDHQTLLRSIREILFALPPNTVVLPGHGPASTIGQEQRNNPFMRES